MRPALPLAYVLVRLTGVLVCLAPAPACATILPFGVGMSWAGECSQPGVIGGAPPASVSGGSGPLVGQASYVAPVQLADCPGQCAPPPLPPTLCTGSRWDGSGSVGLGTFLVHSRAWSAAYAGPGDYLASGTVTGEWGDTLTIVSGSLPAGTPVKLRLELALSSTTTPIRPAQQCGTYPNPLLAGVTASFSAAPAGGSPSVSGTLTGACEGTVAGTTAFIVDTVVGDDVALQGTLSAEANSWAAAEFVDEITTLADGLIDGGAAYHFYVDSFTPGAGYTTASGAGYASLGPPPPCGNGALDAGEACDDGNLADGDCCSSACQVEAAGTVCRDAADACDVAETCDGASSTCPADARLPDADADGVCDAFDLCANVGGVNDMEALLRLTNVDTDSQPADDRLKLRADLELPSGSTFADLAPNADGLRLVLLKEAGAAFLDAALPGGAPAGPGTRGWTPSVSGRRWSYRDDTAEPIGSVTKARLVARDGVTGRRVRIVVRGAGGTYGVGAADLPVHVLLLFGGATCGERRFAPDDCHAAATGKRLVCRD